MIGISSGQVSSGITLEGNSMYVYSGGLANDVVVNSGGVIYASGGMAENIVLNSGGSLLISNRGAASGVFVERSGLVRILKNGSAAEVKVSSGGKVFVSDGLLGSTVLNRGGSMYVRSGGTANETDVYGRMDVLSGTANETAVNSYGIMYVSRGGTANETTVNAGGRMDVFSGGTANETAVNSYGSMYVSSGGTASGAVVSSGTMYVCGGSAALTTVKSGGDLMVVGGVANYTFVSGNSDTHISVSGGGLTSSTTLNDGYFYVFSGGTANDTTVNGDGTMYVRSRGTANDTTVNAGGYMAVSKGGTANSTTVNGSGAVGCLHVESGGVANFTFVNGGSMYILSGGLAKSVIVNDSGWLTIGGGTVSGATVNSGIMSVARGVANNTVVSGGSMVIYSGGKVTGKLTIAEGAVVSARASGIVDFDISVVSAGAAARVNNLSLIQGTPDYTVTVSDAQLDGTYALADNAAGFASAVTLTVGNETYADALTLGNTYTVGDKDYTLALGDNILTLTVGDMEPALPPPSDAVKTYLSNSLVSAAGIMTGKAIFRGGEADTMLISSGGMVNETTVYSSGIIYVYDGGTASDITVNSGGSMQVSRGGAVSGLMIVGSGGSVRINSGGAVYDADVAAGILYTIGSGSVTGLSQSAGQVIMRGSGAWVSGATVHGGTLYFQNGASGTDVTVSSGGLLNIYEDRRSVIASNTDYCPTVYNVTVSNRGTASITSGGRINGITLAGGSLLVNRLGTVSGANILSGGSMSVSSGGSADETVVKKGGLMYVSKGGIADHVVVSGGYLRISSGGGVYNADVVAGSIYTLGSGSVTDLNQYAGQVIMRGSGAWVSGATVHGGTLYFQNGASGTDIVVSSGAQLQVYEIRTLASGTHEHPTAENVIISGGSARIYSGGIVNSITVLRGTLSVSSRGIANSTVVSSGGTMSVTSGGTADSTVVNSMGRMHVYRDGTADSTVVNSKGFIYISNGGSANETVVNGWGSMYVSSSGVANGTTVESNGYLYVNNGGRAYDVTISAGGRLGGFGWETTRHWDYIGNGSAVVADNAIIVGNSMFVSSGGVADGTVVNSMGRMYVINGGTANSTTVVSTGYLYVYNGGTASETTVAGSGWIHVSNGGTANGTVVNGMGRMYVYSGGTANSTTVLSTGYLYVNNGGTGNETTVNGMGRMYVASGGTANGITVNAGGSMTVVSGGKVAGTLNLASGAAVSAYAGSILDFDISVVSAESAALVNDLSLICGAPDYTITVSADQAYGTYRLAGGAAGFASAVTLTVGNDAYADALTVGRTCTVGSRDYTLALGGGTLTLTVGSSTAPQLPTGAVRTYLVNSPVSAANVMTGKTLVGSGTEDKMIITSGGTANSTFVDDNGIVFISKGGRANYTVLNSGVMVISSGGMALKTDMNGGRMFALSGGTGSLTTVNGGATLHASGGRVFSTVVNEGSMRVDLGGIAIMTTVNSGGMLELNRGMASRITVSGGSLFVSSTGSAYDAFLHEGYMLVGRGGMAYKASVDYWGCMEVYGGMASSTFVSMGGYMYVVSGGRAYNTTVGILSGGVGALHIYEGGSAYNTVVNGSVYVASGGGATLVVVNSGGWLDIGGVVSSATVNSGIMNVFCGVAKNTVINSNGSMLIDSGGKITGMLTVSGGMVSAFAGGIIDFDISTVSAGDAARVNDLSLICGAPDYTITVSADQAYGTYRLAGGAADFDGTITVNTVAGTTLGTVAIGETLNASDASYTLAIGSGNILMLTVGDFVLPDGAVEIRQGGMPVSAADIMTGKTIRGGGENLMRVGFGGTADSTTVSSGASMLVSNGGTANATIVVSSGRMYVFNGGTANATALRGGYVFVSAGGAADHTVVHEGWLYVSSGGAATSTTVYSGGMYLMNRASASDISVSAGTVRVLLGGSAEHIDVRDRGNLLVSSGGSVADIRLYGGKAVVYNGGAASGAFVSSGHMRVGRGGTVSDTIVSAGGSLYVSSGGKVTGTLTVEGGMVSAYAGGNIDFDISTVSAGDAARVNDLSLIRGTPDYTVTVSATQTEGTYALAGGAANFDGTVTVVTDTGSTIGDISVGGTLTTDDYTYVLALAAGTLSLKVSEATPEPPAVLSVTADITSPTNRNVTVTATFNGTTKTKQYSLDGNVWRTYVSGVVQSENGTVYFRGIDAAGNFSDVAAYDVTNIDMIAPESPLAFPSTSEPTNGSVTVFAEFSDDTVTRQYSLNNSSWQLYTSGVAMTYNGTVYFRGIDAAGNISEITKFTVANISGALPVEIRNDSGVLISAAEYISGEKLAETKPLMTIHSGGIVEDLEVGSSGEVRVFDGGTVSYAYVSRSELFVNGGLAENVEINHGAAMYVSNGGVASNTVVDLNGAMFVFDGGVACGNTVSAIAELHVSSGGTATYTTIQGGKGSKGWRDGSYSYFGGYGLMCVSSGGTAGFTTVFSSGSMLILSGGKHTGTLTLEQNGCVIVSGGIIDFDISQLTPGGTVLTNGFSSIQGTPEYTITVSATQGGGVYAIADGAWSADPTFTVFTDMGDRLGIVSLGSELDVGKYTYCLVKDENKLLLSISGTWGDNTPPDAPIAAADITSVTRGDVTVTATFSDDSEQRQYSFDRSIWYNYTSGVAMTYNGTVYFRGIDAAGNVSEITEFTVTNILRDGQVMLFSSGALISSAAFMCCESLDSYCDLMIVYSGGTAESTFIRDFGTQIVCSGGVTIGADLDGGALYISSGGVASGVGGYGDFHLYSGGSVADIQLYGGNIYLHPGVSFGNTSIGGEIQIQSGASLHDIAFFGGIDIQSGASARDILMMNGGSINVRPGGTLNGFSNAASSEYSYYGSIYIHSGGTISSAVLGSGCLCELNVLSGGTASGITVGSNGGLYVADGATALEITENGGYVYFAEGADITFVANVLDGFDLDCHATLHSGTTANDTVVHDGGDLKIVSGGVANRTTFVNSTKYHDYCILALDSAGTANDTVIDNYGNMYMYGGTANDTILIEGYLSIHDGTLHNLTMSGGELQVDGGMLTGKLAFATAGTIDMYGGTIDFDLAAADENSVLVNDLSLIHGTPNYTITVSATQAEGTYALAGGAASFDDTITVKTATGTTLGTVAVGETLTVGDSDYTLALGSGDTLTLTLTVLDRVSPYFVASPRATVDGYSVSIEWQGADNVGVASAAVRFGGEVRSVAGSSFSQSDLAVGTYEYQVMLEDAAGNVTWSPVSSFEIRDVTPPAAPVISYAGPAGLTNGNVAITVSFAEDAVVRQYRFNGGMWMNYTDTLVVRENAVVGFRGVDESGNISGITEYTVANIDKTAPTITCVETVTDGDVTLTLSFADANGIAQRRYLLNGAAEWADYTEPLAITQNGLVKFYARDMAGNETYSQYEVSSVITHIPDLVIGTPRITRSGGGASLTAEDPVAVSFSVFNAGDAAIAETSVSVFVDDELMLGLNVTDLNASEGIPFTVELDPLSSGDHTIRIVGDPEKLLDESNEDNNTVVQTLHVDPVTYSPDVFDLDAPNDTPATATDLRDVMVGSSSITGLTVHSADDVDYFKFTLPAAGSDAYRLGISSDPAFGDLDIALLSEDGVVLARSETATGVETLSLNGFAAGTYCLKVYGRDGATNRYTLNWNFPANAYAVDGFETNDDLLTATAIGTGVTYSATIHNREDVDCYSFALDRLGRGSDRLTVERSAGVGELYITILDGSGNVIRETKRGALGKETLSLASLGVGNYFVRVSGAESEYRLNLDLSNVTGDIYDVGNGNDTRATATGLGILSGRRTIDSLSIHVPDDVDFFEFILSESAASIDSISITHDASCGDLDIYLYDASGTEVGRSFTNGDTESIGLGGLSAGRYYLKVAGYNGSTNNYSLNCNVIAGSISADRYETAEPIAIRQSQTIGDLSVSPASAAVTVEDTFMVTLATRGNQSSKILLTDYREDWNGLSWRISQDGFDIASGVGSEISLNGFAAGDYTLVLDSPVDGQYSNYSVTAVLPEKAESESWTVLVYVDGDNNLDGSYLWDLYHMQKARLNENVNVYVMFDRNRGMSDKDEVFFVSNSYIRNWSDTRVGKLVYSPGYNITVDWDSWGELDMGSAATFDRFVSWGVEQAPADNYAVILKDHGTSFGYICEDETSKNTMLTIDGIADVLSKYDIGVTVFDACLMGSDLVLSAMAGASDYVVASEGIAWSPNLTIRYEDFLSSVTADMTPEEFAATVVASNGGSVVNKSTMGAFYTADDTILSALCDFAAASSDFTANDWTLLVRAFANAANYTGSAVAGFSDLKQVLGKIDRERASDALKDAVAELSAAATNATSAFKSTPVSYGNGFAIFNPLLSSPNMSYYTYGNGKYRLDYYNSTAGKSAWGDFLKRLKAKSTSIDYILSSTLFNTIVCDGGMQAFELGIFNGNGCEFKQLAVATGDDVNYFTLELLETGVSGDYIVLKSAENANMNISVVGEAASTSPDPAQLTLDASALLSLDGWAAGTYLIAVTADQATNYEMKFVSTWSSGKDHFDYAASNDDPEKATSLNVGYFTGLMASVDDQDWFTLNENTDPGDINISVEGENIVLRKRDAAGVVTEILRDEEDGVFHTTLSVFDSIQVVGDRQTPSAYSITVEPVINEIRKAASAVPIIDDGTQFTNGDRAAIWNEMTQAANGDVYLADGMASGEVRLELDGYNGSRTVLFGAGNTFADIAVNIDFSSGTLRNLAGGADQNGKVGSVDLTVRDDAVISGVSYAGGFGDVGGEVNTKITGGTLGKDFYAGALANYAKSENSTVIGDVSLTIADGKFNGNIYGASAVKTGGFTTGDGDEALHRVGNVTMTVTGGRADAANGAMCIFAGGYATGHDTEKAAPVYTVENVMLDISGGNWGETRGGRGIFGGAFASDNTKSEEWNDTDEGYKGVCAKVGNVNLTISGDAKIGNVYGGGWAQKGGCSVVGDVNINIEGGMIANVYGGGTHSTSGGTTEVGDVTVTVSGGNITGDIYARGQLDGDTTGNAAVIFTGAADFGCGVFGYSYVGGAGEGAVLSFSGYTGEFSGDIGGFDSVAFTAGTSMTLSTESDNVSNGAWEFDLTDRASALAGTSLLTWSGADFANDTIKVSFADDAQAQGGWNIATVVEAFSGTTFEVEIDGAEIAGGLAYKGQIADGDYAGWGFTLDEGTLKFKNLAGA